MLLDWTAVGDVGNRRIDFDIETSPLQIQTDSRVGSKEILWVRFVRVDSNDHEGTGVNIKFTDPPTYSIGSCDITNVSFSMPEGSKPRIWTFKKQNKRLKLLCDGETIFDFDFTKSSEKCMKLWSLNFEYVKFPEGDENIVRAQDFFRQFTEGMYFPSLLSC